jgi:hypothetical protein
MEKLKRVIFEVVAWLIFVALIVIVFKILN